MFVRLPEPTARTFDLRIDGRTVVARSGETLAAVMLATPQIGFRGPGPWCMTGVCQDCAVQVTAPDGSDLGRRLACRTLAAEGMVVSTS